eukprot:CAMPEP_0115010716 /NCGR_PEP_ID=MMETSP0216-20121206/23501_1 /TAXON_ID=223996 /ORGANISM="Protocruzia adherens, Strain Boccale" /LENGTH=64 /DNA_ID=CAMNT_0002379023 /DNA_START=54 /DNA_END=248 /DNA_ORIENTATION=+
MVGTQHHQIEDSACNASSEDVCTLFPKIGNGQKDDDDDSNKGGNKSSEPVRFSQFKVIDNATAS